MELTLQQKIQGYLFALGESTTVDELSRILAVTKSEIDQALNELETMMAGHAITIIRYDDTVIMATLPAVGEVIAEFKKAELSVALSKGALETLVIILYHTHISKSEIDYIRGVNSQFMLRNLLLRGLIEKTESPTDKRTSVYRVTLETLAWLGITNPAELPDYTAFHNEINQVFSEKSS